jgi:hypothetical protein
MTNQEFEAIKEVVSHMPGGNELLEKLETPLGELMDSIPEEEFPFAATSKTPEKKREYILTIWDREHEDIYRAIQKGCSLVAMLDASTNENSEGNLDVVAEGISYMVNDLVVNLVNANGIARDAVEALRGPETTEEEAA